MRPNAQFLGSGRDHNGVPCKFFRGIPSGALLISYDLEALLQAENRRIQTVIKQDKPRYRPQVKNRWKQRRGS